MRGFLLGLVLIPIVVIGVLSIRPGGLRNQLRNVVRRLKLGLALAGVYLVCSSALKIAFPHNPNAEYAIAGIAVVLALVFVVLGQDRDLTR